MRVATPPSPMAFAAAASTWTTSREVGLLEAEDEEQAAYGLDENRVVFTRDADFLRLQDTGVPHAGIIYRAKDTRGTSCHAIHKSWHACS